LVPKAIFLISSLVFKDELHLNIRSYEKNEEHKLF
jgi:hypothetical protein